MEDSKYGNQISVQVRNRGSFLFDAPNIFVYETWAEKGESEGCWWTLYSMKKCWIVQKAITVLWAIFTVQSGSDCTYVEARIAPTSTQVVDGCVMCKGRWKNELQSTSVDRNFVCTIPHQSYPCYFSALSFPMENCTVCPRNTLCLDSWWLSRFWSASPLL